MFIRILKYILSAAFFVGLLPVFGQERNIIDEEGEVVEGEFLINKELEITMPSAQRIFQKVPPDEINTSETEPLEYTFKNYTPPLSDIRTRLRVLKLKEEKFESSKPGNYFNIGFGNYFTPYLEAGLNSGSNKTGNYGIRLHHLSSMNGPVDKDNSGDSHSSIDLFGKYVGGKASIAGDLGYNRDGYHFYGYDEGVEVSKDSIKQLFNSISLGFDIKSSTTEGPVHYGLYGKLHHIADDYDASEFGFKTGLSGKYVINESMQAKLGIDALLATYKNPDKISRSLVRVYPAFVYKIFGLRVDVGMKIVNHNDTLNNKNNTQIFPAIQVDYNLSDNFIAYGKLDGDVEEVTYRNIVQENPYVNGNLPVAHTNKNLDLQFGLKGTLIQYLAFDVGIRSAIFKNMYFYVNDPLAFNRFSLLYDGGNTTLFQGFATLTYFKSNTLGANFSTRFNAYGTGDVDKAWHRPKIELDASFWYNFYDKVKLTTDLFILSGIEAPDFREDPYTSGTLSGAIDLNLKVDYVLSEKYSVFVSINNLLNNNYQVYYRYPTRGLLALVGLSISF